MVAVADTQFLITDRNLNVVGDPITSWTALDIVDRFQAPGSGQFTAPASRRLVDFLSAVLPPEGWLLDQIEPSYRVVMLTPDGVYSAGPIESWEYDDDTSTNAGGTVTVTWATDLALIAGRLTYPDPTLIAESQTAVARWTATGNAEDLMRSLVNLNCGPGALAERRIPSLVLGADMGVGTSVTWGTRFQPLCDDLRSIATVGGNLGFQTAQTGAGIEFQVYQPRDLSGQVRFSKGLGNLTSAKLTVTAPKATVAIVAGQGEGTSRAVVEIDGTGVADWWRLEQFVDSRSTSVYTELVQAGNEALGVEVVAGVTTVTGGESVKLETVTVDTPTQRYGEHFQLGDRVSVEVWPGRVVTDLVREVHTTADSGGGGSTTVMVGSQTEVFAPTWVRQLRHLDRRVGLLEVI